MKRFSGIIVAMVLALFVTSLALSGAQTGRCSGGFGQRDPQAQAATLKESLEGIRLSAEYLNKAKFVK